VISHGRYLVVLAALFAALWIALAIEPRYRQDWALENALVAVSDERSRAPAEALT